jgi:YVTN family beta-propeller protein
VFRENIVPLRRHSGIALALVVGLAAALWVLGMIGSHGGTAQGAKPVVVVTVKPAGPTHSSPIAMSLDGKLVWSVNPADDSVTVIRTDRDAVVAKVKVGDEPQSVALDPAGRYAYVANTAGSSMTVIRIVNPAPNRFRAKVDPRFGPRGRITTGAEPWAVVASPDARRVFVSNSGQDTVTVLDVANRRLVGHIELRRSRCNAPDTARAFNPRAMAVTKDSTKLYVTRFFAVVKPGGVQADDNGRVAQVCRVDIKTASSKIADYKPARLISMGSQTTGFTVDSTGDGVPDATAAFPNQLGSIVIKGNDAYLPNIAASPSSPLRFNVDTQAFVSVIGGVNGRSARDDSTTKFLNLHLGARNPEPGKKRLFFANPAAIGFAKGNAYVVSSGSDLLVKVKVAGSGKLSFTVDDDTTRYIDLNDPANPATAGANAGKNPIGIAVNAAGTKAYVNDFVSRNVSVVNLSQDRVVKVVRATALPRPGSLEEVVLVGAEMFFSSRGHFDRPAGTTASTDERLSSEGWQNCASCHFKGLTDGIVWSFNDGPRKSVPLNATFSPSNPDDRRAQNYSSIRDEVEDFELNIRNVSGPGPLATAQACATPASGQPATSTFDPNHGLLIADTGDRNLAPCTINNFALKNSDRQQMTVTLPGSTVAVPALTAMREWVRRAVRTPNGPLRATGNRPGVNLAQVAQGRTLFAQACASCHGGPKWTRSTLDFTPPPAAGEIATERTPAPVFGNPVASQYLSRFITNIGSFGLGVPGGSNPIGNNVGGVEKAAAGLVNGVSQPPQDALGVDYNADGKGNGFNIPSLLGIQQLPPYYHNGACETLVCVVGNIRHRTANFTRPDVLANPADVTRVVRFLETIGANTAPLP